MLIIAAPQDTGGLRVAVELRRRQVPLTIVSINQLLLAPVWSHDPMVGTEITLGNGVSLSNESIGAVLCRIQGVDPPQFVAASLDDRIYSQEEFFSLLLSWLEQLGPKVHNRPHAGNLSGERGSALEDRLWLVAQGALSAPLTVVSSARRLSRQAGAATTWQPGHDEAALAGFPFTPVSKTLLAGRPAVCVTHPGAEQMRQIVVIGDRVIGDKLPPVIEAQAITYARLRNLSIVSFEAQEIEPGQFCFCSMNPSPELTDVRAIDAVCDLLQQTLARQVTSP